VNGNHNYKGCSPTSGDGLATIAERWPTPIVPNGGRTTSVGGNGHAKHLGAIAVIWPTPKAEAKNGRRGNDPRHGRVLDEEAAMWPTPKGAAANYGRPREDDRGDLQAASVLWGTPTGSMTEPYDLMNAKGQGLKAGTTGQAHAMETIGSHFRPPLETETGGQPSSETRRTLSPPFVEWLMGFPTGYTACEPLATPWCPFKQRWRCALSRFG